MYPIYERLRLCRLRSLAQRSVGLTATGICLVLMLLSSQAAIAATPKSGAFRNEPKSDGTNEIIFDAFRANGKSYFGHPHVTCATTYWSYATTNPTVRVDNTGRFRFRQVAASRNKRATMRVTGRFISPKRAVGTVSIAGTSCSFGFHARWYSSRPNY